MTSTTNFEIPKVGRVYLATRDMLAWKELYPKWREQNFNHVITTGCMTVLKVEYYPETERVVDFMHVTYLSDRIHKNIRFMPASNFYKYFYLLDSNQKT